ncbi:MAG TPA: YCF48-related protein [Blastocatellia bacterium]|nr:YCF48-related protein [Blastocatellia bacterium]
MIRRLALVCTAAAMVAISSCSPAKVPGKWSPVDTGTGDAFYSVNFVSDMIGWANGQTDRDYVSPEDAQNSNANGNANSNKNSIRPAGKRSTNQNSNSAANDPLKANQGFEVLHTTDGGQTWKQIPDQFKYKIQAVWFVDPQTGWALTIDRDILHTTDGGATWTTQRKAGTVKYKQAWNRHTPELDLPERIDHMKFIDSQHGWAWGGGQRNDFGELPGVLLTTVNGGQNWNEVPFPFTQDVQSMFFLDARHAWASTKEGLYNTTDGGLNWSKIQTRLPEIQFNAIFFTDDKTGFVVGRSGRMARTTDGGHTWWKMVDIKNEFVMRDIYFTDKDHGWAVGDNGAVLYTTDSGSTWVSLDPQVSSKLVNITFVNPHTGWASGLDGAVLKYEPVAR